MPQTIIACSDSIQQLENILCKQNVKRYLLVCDQSFPYLTIRKEYSSISVPSIEFDGFKPNPLYEDVCDGIKLFNDQGCDAIVAIGGGSTIDVAKCIKLFCQLEHHKNYMEQTFQDNGILLIALPTTAGTGSESTQHAVIYYQDEKQSITHFSILPDYAILDHKILSTLPLYQKKCTMLDALCQGIESWWSVNSSDESKAYAKTAISLIWENKDVYIQGDSADSAANIMLAANFAGRAINLTQTTAAHAMSYKLTSLYQLPHGHAVAVCLPPVWRYLVQHITECVDPRGSAYLLSVFEAIAHTLGAGSVMGTVDSFSELLVRLAIQLPKTNDVDDLKLLSQSVNTLRLGNTPVNLGEETLYALYTQIVEVT